MLCIVPLIFGVQAYAHFAILVIKTLKEESESAGSNKKGAVLISGNSPTISVNKYATISLI